MIKPTRPGRGSTIYGSKGSIMLDRNFYQLYDLDGNLLKEELEGGSSETTNTRGEGQLDTNHISNFFAGIREDKSLNSDISDASVSTMLCHLGNMAQDARETLKIDTATGKITNNAKAMESWKRTYAEGWEPVL
jgi:hypothetical protein